MGRGETLGLPPPLSADDRDAELERAPSPDARLAALQKLHPANTAARPLRIAPGVDYLQSLSRSELREQPLGSLLSKHVVASESEGQSYQDPFKQQLAEDWVPVDPSEELDPSEPQPVTAARMTSDTAANI